MSKPMLCKGGLFALALIVVSATLAPARAEMYIAGHVGVTVPRDTTQGEVQGTGDPFTDPTKSFPTSLSDLNLQTSLVYGGKVGYYFEKVKALGVEIEGFNTTPNIKQQTGQLIQQGQDPVPVDVSGTLRVTTLAVNLVVRYPGKKFQPYAGAGPGVFWAHLKTPVDSDTSTKPGFNTLVGLRYLLTDHIAVFGEWKYQHAVFNFSTQMLSSATLPLGQANSLSGVQLHYNANMFTFGLSYHF
jgi:opacity protein-like surface antigen